MQSWVVSTLGLIAGLTSCASQAAEPKQLAPFSAQNLGEPQMPWKLAGLPGKPERVVTDFKIAVVDGKKVLSVKTDKSYGNAIHEWADASAPIAKLRWSWRLDSALGKSDITTKSGDDVALKVCVLFNMPTAKLSMGERFKLATARNIAAQALPSATICYLWDTSLAVGTYGPNPFSERVRYVVMASGPARAQWLSHTVDVAADFAKYFGHESATLPPVMGIAVGGDADNTQGTSLGHVGDVQLLP